MENKKVMKNMEYWKKKNNIPGIEGLADSGLTDGRAGSSAFQMAAPVAPNVFKEDENTEVGKELLKEEAKKAMKAATLQAGAMGTGALMMKKSPFQQEEVGGEEKANSIMGQEIEINEDGTMSMSTEYDVAGIPSGATVEDPNGILEIKGGFVMDEDYTFEVDGNTVIITGVGEVDPDAPGTPGEPGYEPPVEREDLDDEGKKRWDELRGGVGEAPMEMHSPVKNYKNPQDYKVFNFGNEPTPFEAEKQKRKPKRYGSY